MSARNFVIGMALAVALQAQTLQRVPFVGCKADGQVGPVEAPEGSSVAVAIGAKEAEQLAYYKAAPTIGVLAPRGWHCAATYGSSGGTLYVLPEGFDPKDMFSSERPKIAGAAIQVSSSSGETSGRYFVAEIIARVFPEYKKFVADVIEMYDLPANTFPAGPYPTDTIRHEGDRVVEYRTPPQTEGLGTHSWLGKGDRPIYGAAMLVGPVPDLQMIAVRLPESLESLARAIIARFEQDGAAQ